MGRRFGWLSAGVVLVAAACIGESITSPDACPAYCSANAVAARDTLFTGAISNDQSYRGYVTALSSSDVQVAGTAGVREARAVVKFYPFPMRYQVLPTDTTTTALQSVDSLRLNVMLRHRAGGPVDIAVYRLPRASDTLVSYDGTAPFFHDSTKVVQATINQDTGQVVIVLPVAALPTLVADSFEVVLGLAVVSPAAGHVRFGANEAGIGAFVERFIQVDSGAVPVRIKRMDARLAQFDTFVFQDLPAPGTNVLAIGGAPSARSIMKLTLPSAIVDSSSVVRATLLLIPAGPALSAAGDTVRLVAHALASEIGAKSPVAAAGEDSEALSGGYVPPASADTIRVDITNLLRLWKADPTVPRVFTIRATPESGALSEVRYFSSADATRKPRVQVTYVPPFRFGTN